MHGYRGVGRWGISLSDALMVRRLIVHSWCACALALALTVSTGLAAPPADAPAIPLDVVGGVASTQIVVTFTPRMMAAAKAPGIEKSAAVRSVRNVGAIPGAPNSLTAALESAFLDWGVTRMRRLHEGPFRDPASAARHGMDRTFIVEVLPGTDTPGMVAALGALLGDGLERADTDGIGTTAQLIPNDTDFCRQLNMHNLGETCTGFPDGTADADVDGPEAWSIHTGDPGTATIAIIDTGVSPHIEFAGRLLEGINTVGNGAFTTDTEDACDILSTPTGHGTHVAGIAAATGNNGVGVAGMTWGANIMPVKVFGVSTPNPNPCSGFASDASEGIRWAVDHGADVCNISLTWTSPEPLLESAVNYAHDNGVLIVSAAGNSFGSPPLFPARYANSMAVCAVNNKDQRAGFSNFGADLDVCAPGVQIYSTFRRDTRFDPPMEDRYGTISGTSMASPHVAGLAALIKSYLPTITHDEIRAAINLSADDIGLEGFDTSTGNGRINAFRALLLASGVPLVVSASPVDGSIDARQPSDPDGSNPAVLWQFVDLTIVGDVSALVPGDFVVTEEGGLGDPPLVVALSPTDQGNNVIRVVLNRPIDAGTRLTFAYLDSASGIDTGLRVRIAYLPGDINASGSVTTDDLRTLFNILKGSLLPASPFSADVDRSGEIGPADILRTIDLFNGAETYGVFLGMSLPPLP